MTNYCYSHDDGEIIERSYRMGTAPKTVRHGGKTYHRDYAAEKPRQLSADVWPRVGKCAGVHPSQAQEAYDKSVKDGVPTNFTSDGDPIFTSAGHRKRYMRSIGAET